jgi:transcriptional regulator of nitric oxide reductase
MRCFGKLLVAGALVAVSSAALGARQTADARQLARLKQLFPAATAFSPKEGDPPHYKAYAGGRGPQTVIGYAFWTTEIVPLERGYGGPIAILVGVEPTGKMAGLIVGEHHEPYGDFSIEPPQFAAQFKGKDIRDPFQLGKDIDAVSRATITMRSAVSAIRTSVRRVARQLLPPPAK